MAKGVIQEMGASVREVTPVPVPDYQAEPNDTAQAISGAVQGLAAVWQQNTQQKVLAQYDAQATEIASKVNGYQDYFNKLQMAQVSAPDRATLDQYQAEITRLRNGEVQGMLSPAAANLQLRALTKTYINRFPHMDESFKGLLSASNGYIPKSEGSESGFQESAWEKGQKELLEEAGKRNIVPQKLLEEKQKEDEDKALAAQVDRMTKLGVVHEPTYRAALTAVYSKAIDGFYNQYSRDVKNGTFKQENYDTAIPHIKTQTETMLRQVAAKLEADSGIRFNPEILKEIINQSNSMFDGVSKNVSSLDSQTSRLKRMQQADDAVKLGVAKTMDETFGLLARIAGPDGNSVLAGKLINMFQMIGNGQSAAWNQQSNTQDTATGLFADPLAHMVDVAYKNGKLNGIVAPWLSLAHDGHPIDDPANPKLPDAIRKPISAATLAAAKDPNISPDERARAFQSFLRGPDILELEKDPNAIRLIGADPNMANLYKESAAQFVAQTFDQIHGNAPDGQPLMNHIAMNKGSDNPVFFTPIKVTEKSFTNTITRDVGAGSYVTPGMLEFQQKTNQAYRILKQMRGGQVADDWLQEVFSQTADSTDSSKATEQSNMSAPVEHGYQSPTLDLKNAPGMLKPPTVKHIFDRPVYEHPDGSGYGTTNSIGISVDGREVIIPTIIDGKPMWNVKDDGTIDYSPAVKHYQKTGEHLGVFDNADNAEAFAEALHKAQALVVESTGQRKKK